MTDEECRWHRFMDILDKETYIAVVQRSVAFVICTHIHLRIIHSCTSVSKTQAILEGDRAKEAFQKIGCSPCTISKIQYHKQKGWSDLGGECWVSYGSYSQLSIFAYLEYVILVWSQRFEKPAERIEMIWKRTGRRGLEYWKTLYCWINNMQKCT